MRVIADRYELVAFVGRGGMGEVWEGRDLVIGRRVAVKLLPDHQHGPAADLFFREARTAGSLNHRGVVTVHDLGRDPRDGTLYLVMEYVTGRNLAVVLREDGPPPPATSADWAAQIAAALAAAHDAGVVHRDLKPANLMLTAGGEVKVLDFGIARFMAATDKSSQVMGTLAYMAPERFAEHSGDARSDLYAFGCVLHELLTGEPPFKESDPVSLMTAHLNRAPEAPSSVREGLPVALDALVLRLLAKQPADRPQSAASVHDALRALDLASARVTAPAAARTPTAPAAAPAAPVTPPAGPPPYGPGGPAPWGGGPSPVAAPPGPRANAAAAVTAGTLALITTGMLVWFALYNVVFALGPTGRWTALVWENVLGGVISAGLLVLAAGFTFARGTRGAWTLCALSAFYVVAIFVAPLLRGTAFRAQLAFVFGFDKGSGVAMGLTVVFGAATAIAAALAGAGAGRSSGPRPPGA
ncbi:serine/threonine-protein kinase [Streptomyces sp. NPDC002138]|uniref:serine/threonine-protein kinase n=1 Tax=Streptomyces sp. NPDC002138 TaxID=3154410 RepID=UPI00332C9578